MSVLEDMTATLTDHRGPTLTIDEAIDILRIARYPFPAIVANINEAIKKANSYGKNEHPHVHYQSGNGRR